MITAITFDVGGTLIAPWPSVGDVYGEVATRLGLNPPSADELNRRFAAVWRCRDHFGYTLAEWRQVVAETFHGTVPDGVVDGLFAALYQRFQDASAWHVFDDVEPTLRDLRERGFKLGIVSNWDDRLRPLLATLGLAAKFDAIIVSCEVGVTKPDARMFHAAARALSVPLSAICHVGDSTREDVAGAQTAGARGVWLDRSGHSRGVGVIARLSGLNFS